MRRPLFAFATTLVVLTFSILTVVKSADRMMETKLDPTKIYGRIQFVNSFPDYKVKAVSSFPDVKVKIVKSLPGSGEWQIVESFPDYKIQLVKAFEDFKVEFTHGVPDEAK